MTQQLINSRGMTSDDGAIDFVGEGVTCNEIDCSLGNIRIARERYGRLA
jgi:hypothetical protein